MLETEARSLADVATRSSTSDQHRRARHERLVQIHTKAVTLILHESRFVLERTNTFLLTTSFLLAAYGVSLSARTLMTVAIPLIGLGLSVIHPFLMARTVRALEFWRATGALIETDDDYWYPERIQEPNRSDVDLDFLLARQRRNRREHVRQDDVDVRMGGPPRAIMRLQSHVPDPNTVFSTYIPMAIAVLWVLAFVIGLGRLDAVLPWRTQRSTPAITPTTSTSLPATTSTTRRKP